MATKEDFQAAFNNVNAALTNIGDDITRLTQQLVNKGLTEQEEADILTELTSLGDRAKNIASITPEDTTTSSSTTIAP